MCYNTVVYCMHASAMSSQRWTIPTWFLPRRKFYSVECWGGLWILLWTREVVFYMLYRIKRLCKSLHKKRSFASLEAWMTILDTLQNLYQRFGQELNLSILVFPQLRGGHRCSNSLASWKTPSHFMLNFENVSHLICWYRIEYRLQALRLCYVPL